MKQISLRIAAVPKKKEKKKSSLGNSDSSKSAAAAASIASEHLRFKTLNQFLSKYSEKFKFGAGGRKNQYLASKSDNDEDAESMQSMLDFDQFYSATRQDPTQAYRNMRESRKYFSQSKSSLRSARSEGNQPYTKNHREHDQMLDQMVNLLIQKKSIKHFESSLTANKNGHLESHNKSRSHQN